MIRLLNETPLAVEWANEALARHDGEVFARLAPTVIWADESPSNDDAACAIDPQTFVERINRNPLLFFLDRDLGRPQGHVLESAQFQASDGRRFIAAVMGYYTDREILEFRTLGLNVTDPLTSFPLLSALSRDAHITIALDPDEADETWLERLRKNAPIPLMIRALSNEGDVPFTLVRVDLPFSAILWSPFTAGIASRPGDAEYSAINGWLRSAFGAVAGLGQYVVNAQSHHDGCDVSFLIRGGDIRKGYAAWDVQPEAAARAAQLIENLHARAMPARRLVYEFGQDPLVWYPSYAVLQDNRIISSNPQLISSLTASAIVDLDAIRWSLDMSANDWDFSAEADWVFEYREVSQTVADGVGDQPTHEPTRCGKGIYPCWIREQKKARD